jgi:hypothetical protein
VVLLSTPVLPKLVLLDTDFAHMSGVLPSRLGDQTKLSKHLLSATDTHYSALMESTLCGQMSGLISCAAAQGGVALCPYRCCSHFLSATAEQAVDKQQIGPLWLKAI